MNNELCVGNIITVEFEEYNGDKKTDCKVLEIKYSNILLEVVSLPTILVRANQNTVDKKYYVYETVKLENNRSRAFCEYLLGF